jgi:hypothetical protein
VNVRLIILIKKLIKLLKANGNEGLAMQDEEDYEVETN